MTPSYNALKGETSDSPVTLFYFFIKNVCHLGGWASAWSGLPIPYCFCCPLQTRNFQCISETATKTHVDLKGWSHRKRKRHTNSGHRELKVKLANLPSNTGYPPLHEFTSQMQVVLICAGQHSRWWGWSSEQNRPGPWSQGSCGHTIVSGGVTSLNIFKVAVSSWNKSLCVHLYSFCHLVWALPLGLSDLVWAFIPLLTSDVWKQLFCPPPPTPHQLSVYSVFRKLGVSTFQTLSELVPWCSFINT